MIKLIVLLTAMLLLGVSCEQTHLRQANKSLKNGETDLDLQIRQVMEKGVDLEERKRQVPVVAEIFSRRTDEKRAKWLAALCYLKTLGTPLMPMDIAEIALAETGEIGLSAKAVSQKGALGVWQLMPRRAMSHGYSPEEMQNDEKCADAAVRELLQKLSMAKGNLPRAKKLYCGVGPQANAYEERRRQFRKEILEELDKRKQTAAAEPTVTGAPL